MSRLAASLICALLASPAAAQEPARGGTLVFGINSGDPPTYDCHQSALFPIIHLLTPHYSNLLKIDTANYPKLIGDLAEDIVRRPIALRDGFVALPDGPGLGVEVDEAAVERFRVS